MIAQFGNDKIQNIILTDKLDSAYGLVLGMFFIQLFSNWTACGYVFKYLTTSPVLNGRQTYISRSLKVSETSRFYKNQRSIFRRNFN